MEDNRPLWQRQRDALRAEAEAADADDLFAVADQVEQETRTIPAQRESHDPRDYAQNVIRAPAGWQGTFNITAASCAEPMYCTPWPDAITKYPLPAVQYEVRVILNLRTLADDPPAVDALCAAFRAELLRALAGFQRP